MAELWTRAVREAAEDPATDLGTAARDALADLWYDLDEARRDAVNGRWSMGCDNVTRRIVTLSRLVGSTSWRQVPGSLLEDGIYQGILRDAGIQFAPPDMDEVRELQAAIRANALKPLSAPGRDARGA